LGLDPLRVGGTPEQQERWFGRVADKGLIVAYAVTEPEAGSNVAAITTRAEREGNRYRITGTKQFITNGSVADLYTVLARTERGLSFFLVEEGTPGLSFGPPEHKHGIRSSITTQVILEDVEAPDDHLIGEREGQGLRQANEVFASTRLMVAAMALGAGEAALERAIAYSRERRQLGSLLCEKPGYTHDLILPYYVRLTASRALIEEVAREVDRGGMPSGEASTRAAMAKLLATESANAAAEASIQALGGYGYMHEYEVEKIKRDVRITTIYEGTSEIQKNIIAVNRWKDLIRGRGERYIGLAREAEDLGEPTGGHILAAALRNSVAAITEARKRRLSSHGYFQLRLGAVLAHMEGSMALTRKAKVVEGMDGPHHTASRIYAGECLNELLELASAFDLRLPGPVEGKSGYVQDLDHLAAQLFDRV